MRKPWPHAPTHLLLEQGVYMVTSGTYLKAHHFREPQRRDLLQTACFNLLEEFGWTLLAWSFFSNHYHLVLLSPSDPSSMTEMLRRLHGTTSREVNRLDSVRGRKVWHEFWDRNISFERSYLARLNYVMQNPVKHGLVREAAAYPWCSEAWFSRTAPRSFVNTVAGVPWSRVREPDTFDPE